MDNIFSNCENIAPSFIANRTTDIKDEEPLNIKFRLPKKPKKNNVQSTLYNCTLCKCTPSINAPFFLVLTWDLILIAHPLYSTRVMIYQNDHMILSSINART